MSGRGLTSWRSAANAPDKYQSAVTIVGAFDSCNGVLGRRKLEASTAGSVVERHRDNLPLIFVDDIAWARSPQDIDLHAACLKQRGELSRA